MTYNYQLLDIPAGELREEVDYRYGNRYFKYKQFRFDPDEMPVVLCNESEFNLLKSVTPNMLQTIRRAF